MLCHAYALPIHKCLLLHAYTPQRGTSQEVATYLRTNPLPSATELERLGWKMLDKACYDAVTAVLRERYTFSKALWSFALYHRCVSCRVMVGCISMKQVYPLCCMTSFPMHESSLPSNGALLSFPVPRVGRSVAK